MRLSLLMTPQFVSTKTPAVSANPVLNGRRNTICLGLKPSIQKMSDQRPRLLTLITMGTWMPFSRIGLAGFVSTKTPAVSTTPVLKNERKTIRLKA